MKLKELLYELDYKCISGDINTDVCDLIYDSRKAVEGCAFFCISGAVTDGHIYAKDAVKKGATAVIAEEVLDLPENITQILVVSCRDTLAHMSAVFFGNPAKRLKLIGITGTKGKTSTSYMIKDIIEKSGHSCGLIGTVGVFWKDNKVKTGLTTPESYVIHSLLKKMADDGCEYVVMEVSSQALMLHRTAGIEFDIAVFMNFSPDHIGKGEHSSLEEYRKCKEKLFKQAKTGIFNADDEVCDLFVKNSLCEQNYIFGELDGSDLCIKDIRKWSKNGVLGVSYRLSGMIEAEVMLEIPGLFNVYNSTAAAAVCSLLGIDTDTIVRELRNVRIPGRVELVNVSDRFSVIVDYAHNEVSTRSVLQTLREYDPSHIICVYGAGGNRSKLRRYDMGEVTGELADMSVLTCDNPRDEEIKDINEDIKVGLARHNGRYVEIEDRVEAIAYAIRHAEKGDIILLLGKGHEDYMEIKGVKYPYSERDAVIKACELVKKDEQ